MYIFGVTPRQQKECVIEFDCQTTTSSVWKWKQNKKIKYMLKKPPIKMFKLFDAVLFEIN